MLEERASGQKTTGFDKGNRFDGGEDLNTNMARSTMMSVSERPIWSFQKIVITGIGKSAALKAPAPTSSEGLRSTRWFTEV